MAFRVHLLINLSQRTFGIDHERGAVPIHRPFVFALAYTRCIQQFMILIGQQVDREEELVAEILMRLDIISADADDGDIRIVEFLLCRRE